VASSEITEGRGGHGPVCPHEAPPVGMRSSGRSSSERPHRRFGGGGVAMVAIVAAFGVGDKDRESRLLAGARRFNSQSV
jgi:hypothetical protein